MGFKTLKVVFLLATLSIYEIRSVTVDFQDLDEIRHELENGEYQKRDADDFQDFDDIRKELEYKEFVKRGADMSDGGYEIEIPTSEGHHVVNHGQDKFVWNVV